jgi:hypothetical protein
LIPALIALQSLVVVFIALHDWVPLGALNDVKAAQATDTRAKLARVTALSTLPFAVGLAGSIYFAAAGFPTWLWWWLWISYGVACYGVVRTWWLPYLFVPDPQRAERYRMFARTHAFLPIHNGIRPNTLHVAFHIVLVVTIVVLAKLTFF